MAVEVQEISEATPVQASLFKGDVIEILEEVLKELKRAKKKHPRWYDHPAAQAGVVMEEAGELIRACMIWKYERASHGSKEYNQQVNAMRMEAIQTAAMAIRFIENLK